MPLEYYHNTQLLFTVDPLYRQLTTASPSTLLDIKKLQKLELHRGNLLLIQPQAMGAQAHSCQQEPT